MFTSFFYYISSVSLFPVLVEHAVYALALQVFAVVNMRRGKLAIATENHFHRQQSHGDSNY